MPITLGSVLIIAAAMVPGVIAEKVFRSLVGVDWREKEWRGIVRVVGFSAVGVTLYSLVAAQLGLPAPIHIFPASYAASALTPSTIDVLFASYAGHLIGGAVAGLLGAWATKGLATLSSGSAYPSAWDDLVRVYAPDHWVVVGLTSGDVYAGKLKNADVAVSAGDRDLVLEEPAQYDPDTGQYVATPYQYQFISAGTVFSIAVVHDPAKDDRTVPIAQSLFPVGSDEPPRLAEAAASEGAASASPAIASTTGEEGGLAP